jgi:hypothetical protein
MSGTGCYDGNDVSTAERYDKDGSTGSVMMAF